MVRMFNVTSCLKYAAKSLLTHFFFIKTDWHNIIILRKEVILFSSEEYWLNFLLLIYIIYSFFFYFRLIIIFTVYHWMQVRAWQPPRGAQENWWFWDPYSFPELFIKHNLFFFLCFVSSLVSILSSDSCTSRAYLVDYLCGFFISEHQWEGDTTLI